MFAQYARPLHLEDIFETVEIFVGADNCLELLQRELVTTEHQLHSLFVKCYLVLFEEIDKLTNVKRPRAVGVELLEYGLDDVILFDLLLRHEVLFLDLGSVVTATAGRLLTSLWLIKLVELHLAFQPVLGLVHLELSVFFEEIFEARI